MDPSERIIQFLRRIGIVVTEGAVRDESFLPGVRIESGEIVVEREKLTWPGDLLHEAGHIAVTPPRFRHSLSNALDGHMTELDAGEPEVSAWAYAACLEIGLDPSVLFHPGGYQGQSEGLLMTFSVGVYPGSAGLTRIGMTVAGPVGMRGQGIYPEMIHWMRTE